MNAVNALKGTSKTFDDLFAEFTVAVTGISSSHSSVYTHNQNAAQTISYDSYSYPMKAFNLWDSSFSLEDTEFQTKMNGYKYSRYDFYGPYNSRSWKIRLERKIRHADFLVFRCFRALFVRRDSVGEQNVSF